MSADRHYWLALRNQPQWQEVAAFLAVQKLRAEVRDARKAAGRRVAPQAPVRSIPDGNHGDNLRSVTGAECRCIDPDFCSVCFGRCEVRK